MTIIPAIDLKEGCCVRLEQGQFDRVSQYDHDPKTLVSTYAEQGATHLHLVDLDGAKQGHMQQWELLKTLRKGGLVIQVGGGIRNIEIARKALHAGIDRIVLGSLAINNQEETLKIIQEVGPHRVVLALDVKIENAVPKIAIHGWQKETNHSLWDIVLFYQGAGIDTILCTDIHRDGMLCGPSIGLYEEAVKLFPMIQWQASGGIRDAHDINKLSAMGLSAVILGRVLYDPHFDLKAVIQEHAC